MNVNVEKVQIDLVEEDWFPIRFFAPGYDEEKFVRAVYALREDLKSRNSCSLQNALTSITLDKSEAFETLSQFATSNELSEILPHFKHILTPGQAADWNKFFQGKIPPMLKKTTNPAASTRVIELRRLAGRLFATHAAEAARAGTPFPWPRWLEFSPDPTWKQSPWPVERPCTVCGARLQGEFVGHPSQHRHHRKHLPALPVKMGICTACGHRDTFGCACQECQTAFEPVIRALEPLSRTLPSLVGIRNLENEHPFHDSFINALQMKEVVPEMERDHIQYKNDLTGDLRAVFAYHPTTSFEDFCSCIQRVCKSRKLEPNTLWKEALEAHIIYRKRTRKFVFPLEYKEFDMFENTDWRTIEPQRVPTDPITVPEDLKVPEFAGLLPAMQLIIQIQYLSLAQAIGRIMPALAAMPDLRNYANCCRRLFNSNKACVRIELENRHYLNPHYFKKPEDVTFPVRESSNTGEKKFLLPLFGSPMEECAFQRHVGPGRIPIPNRLLRQVIDLERLKCFFNPKEYRYLLYCILDLCIYNSKGELLCVEEVQRGKHHNKPDYIWKDSVKRRALEIADVKFLESF